jgi:hypothetical protein
LACSKVDPKLQLRLIHVRRMRRKGHPYRQRQISALKKATQQIKILRRYRPTRPSPVGSTGLHKVTSSESRGPDLQITQHSRKDTNYKAAVAQQCPVRKRWEHEGSLGTCTVLVPRPCGEMFIGVIPNLRPLGYEGNGGRQAILKGATKSNKIRNALLHVRLILAGFGWLSRTKD